MSNHPEYMEERLRRRNLFVLTAGSFLRGTHQSIYNVIWQPLALSLGASMSMVGLLNSLGGMNGIFTTVAQSLGGWLADRIGCKSFIISASLLVITAYVFFYVSALSLSQGLFLAGIIILGLSALSRPAITSMTAESAKRELQGSMFSLISFAWIVPGTIAPSAGGWLVERWGFAGVFPILMTLEALSLFLAWRFLFEERRSWDDVDLVNIGRAFLRSFLPLKGLKGFFIATAGDSFVWALSWGLVNGMLRDAYNFSVAQLGIMASVMSVSWAVVQMPIGRWLDRHSAKTMLVFSEALGIPLMMITILHPTFPVMVALQVPFAIIAATWIPTVSTYVARAVDATVRTEAFGRLNMFRGLVAFPASWIGGLIYDRWGFKAPFIATVIGIFFILFLLVFFVHEPEVKR